jgi:hypothetical protein
MLVKVMELEVEVVVPHKLVLLLRILLVREVMGSPLL